MLRLLLIGALLPSCAGCTLLRDASPIVRTETVRIEVPGSLTAPCEIPDRPAPVTVEVYIQRMETAEAALDECAARLADVRAWGGKDGRADQD